MASSAHPAFTQQQEILHPLAGWLVEGFLQVIQQARCSGMLDPAFGTDMGNPRFCIEPSHRAHIRGQVGKLGVSRHYQISMPLVAPSAGIGNQQ